MPPHRQNKSNNINKNENQLEDREHRNTHTFLCIAFTERPTCQREEKEKDSYQHEEHTPSNRVSILYLGGYAQMTQPHQTDIHHTRNELGHDRH